MTARPTHDPSPGRDIASALKGWVMVALTLTFVLLYVAALVGLLKPLESDRMVARLEPIIFAIIGYYFGRLPSQQNEKALKDEISRQVQKADAAQHAKEQAQQNREALEERVKNARAALTSVTLHTPARDRAEHLNNNGASANEDALRHSVNAALGILNL